MRWLQTEYILKGIYLGLLAFAAVQGAAADSPTWQTPALLTLYTFAGLALALAVAALLKVRQGYQVQGRVPAFILFLLLESPTLVYAGILGGTVVGVAVLGLLRDDTNRLLTTVGGGAALGVVFGFLPHVKDRWARLGLSLALGAGLVAGALYSLGIFPEQDQQARKLDLTVFCIQVLLGIPVFYLLTFSGHEEESEVEIGAMCAALGLGAGLLSREYTQFQSVGFLVPVFLYFYYTMYILPKLRVFKHALRGLSHARIGRHRQALLAFRRALTLDPNSELARDGFWGVHRALDFDQLAHDPQTLALVDFDLCLDRAGALLLQPPTPAKLAEANRLLDLVLSQRPQLRPTADYWRAVAPYALQKLRRSRLRPDARPRPGLLRQGQRVAAAHPAGGVATRPDRPRGAAPARRPAATGPVGPAHGGDRRRRAPPGGHGRRPVNLGLEAHPLSRPDRARVRGGRRARAGGR